LPYYGVGDCVDDTFTSLNHIGQSIFRGIISDSSIGAEDDDRRIGAEAIEETEWCQIYVAFGIHTANKSDGPRRYYGK